MSGQPILLEGRSNGGHVCIAALAVLISAALASSFEAADPFSFRDLLARPWQEIVDVHQDLTLLPESIETRFVLGHALIAQDRPSEAMAVFASVSQDRDIQRWRTSAASATGDVVSEARSRFFLGDAELRLGNYSQAIASFSRAIELDRTSALLYLARASAYLLSGRFDKQPEADLRKALDIAPISEAYNALAILHLMRGDAPKAADLAREGLARNPMSATCNVSLAAALVRQRDYEQALAHYDTAEGLCPPIGKVCSQARSLIHRRIGEQHFDLAAGLGSWVTPEIRMENFGIPFPHIPGRSRQVANFGTDLATLGTYYEPPKTAALEPLQDTKLRRDVIVRMPNYSGVVTAFNTAVGLLGSTSKLENGPLNKAPAPVSPAPDLYRGAMRLRVVEDGGQPTWALFEYRGGANREPLHISNWSYLPPDQGTDLLNTRIAYHERHGKREISYHSLFEKITGHEWHASYALATPGSASSTKNYVPSKSRGMTLGELHELARSNPTAEMRVRTGDTFLKSGQIMTTTVGDFVAGRVPITKLERVRNDVDAYTLQFRQQTGEAKVPDLSWLHSTQSTPQIESRLQSSSALVHVSTVPLPRSTDPGRGGVTLGTEPERVASDRMSADELLFGDESPRGRLSVECLLASLPANTFIVH